MGIVDTSLNIHISWLLAASLIHIISVDPTSVFKGFGAPIYLIGEKLGLAE